MRNLSGYHASKKQHCQQELIDDLFNKQIAGPDEMLKWHFDEYSTSKHLCTMMAICDGVGGKRVGEIGFGRSSFVLASVVAANHGHFTACDRYDYSWMLSDYEREFTNFIVGDADAFYADPRVRKGLDFLFLDYMSTIKKSKQSCYKDMKAAVKLMAQNGIIAIHDACEEKYNVAEAMVRLKKKFGSRIETFTLPYCSGLGLVRRLEKSPYGILKDRWQKKPDTDGK